MAPDHISRCYYLQIFKCALALSYSVVQCFKMYNTNYTQMMKRLHRIFFVF